MESKDASAPLMDILSNDSSTSLIKEQAMGALGDLQGPGEEVKEFLISKYQLQYTLNPTEYVI